MKKEPYDGGVPSSAEKDTDPAPAHDSETGDLSPRDLAAVQSGSASGPEVPVKTRSGPEIPAKAKQEPSIRYRPGDLVSEAAFDPDRLPAGCMYQHGRITRKRKSDRPGHILPEFWAKATPKQRAEWIQEAIDKVEAQLAPAMPVMQANKNKH